jgi:hypothetical protein
MKVKVNCIIQNDVNLEPGNVVNVGWKPLNYIRKTLTVRKIVEDRSGVRVIFNNGTWRPLTTYNMTWWKV